ncbi:unnamed protein product [Thlaspi arvense]|uniref:GDSL esterase/lipase n=1 Tax=Thlaspi arvense TaxID=13288 RepID=A0AAU9RWA9_THLAR|nr:unnamed protein product [Thlaspi arvense]
MEKLILAVGFFLFNLGLFGVEGADDLGLGASFIFGDSLVDCGNNNYLPTLSRANIQPNGIDFKASGGNPTGRGGTGPATLCSSISGSKFHRKAILYGVNYASGGGGILNATGRIFVNRLSLDIQVDYFNITRKQFDKLLGAKQARDYLMKKSIFSITIGSNDFLNNYLLPVLSMGARISQTPEAFIDDLLNHFRDQLTRLYKLDARKFVVGNVGPIGCIPYQKTINRLKEDECVELPNKLALQYNARLKDLLAELNDNLPVPPLSTQMCTPWSWKSSLTMRNMVSISELRHGFLSYLVTVFMFQSLLFRALLGFTTASIACCGNGGQFAGIIPCGPTSSICSDRDKHVFWDPYHPSEAANIIIAKQLLHGDPKYVSPMNLRQLRDL